MKKIVLIFIFFLSLSVYSQDVINHIIIMNDSTVYRGLITKIIPGKSISIETSDKEIIILDINKVIETSIIKEYEKVDIKEVDTEESISVGSFYVQGGSDFTFINVDYYSANHKITQMSLNSIFGTFFTKKIMVGLLIGYESYKDNYGSVSRTSFGPLLRYYYNDMFIGATYITMTQEGSKPYSGFSFEIGYAGFITKHIAIEPSYGYMFQKGLYNSFGLNLSIGVYF